MAMFDFIHLLSTVILLIFIILIISHYVKDKDITYLVYENSTTQWNTSSNTSKKIINGNEVRFTGVNTNTNRIWLNPSNELFLPYDSDWIIEFNLNSANLLALYFTQTVNSETGAVFGIYDTNFNKYRYVKIVYSTSNHNIKYYLDNTLKNTLNASSFTNNIGFKLIDWQGDINISITDFKSYLIS